MLSSCGAPGRPPQRELVHNETPAEIGIVHNSRNPENPEALLDGMEPAIAEHAEAAEDASNGGIDRREFMFMSLVAAAATTFGAHPTRAQGAGGGGAAGAGAAGGAAQQETAMPLGNGEPPVEQFMPYPGGTGALMEKLVKEHGPSAFTRSSFTVDKWSGAVPTSDDDIVFLPAHRLSALIKEKKITSTKLTQIYLARLKKLNPPLLCAVTIMEQQGLAEAARADEEIKAGKYRGPLHGLPYGVKDLFSTKGVPTTWGAADFENRIIDEDAEVVVRLRDAGAVLIAKLSTGLFAQNDQWFRGRTNNPWNLSQGASGSSAGPASATASGCVAFGIGTETSGSIVSPTTRCGLSALRPTFGRVSRYGGMVLAWTQDRVGPICRTVEDAAMVFNAIHGVDEKDPSTVMTPFHFDPAIKLASLRIGVDPNAPPEMIAKLRELGMKSVDIGARPTVPTSGGGLGVEGAAAFDEYVVRKAKETGLDLNALPETPLNGRGGGGGGGGGRGAGAAGGAPANPMAPADWNPRFVSGRTPRALEFMQSQRRRYVLISKWAEFMKNLDMFVAAPNADVGANSQTGHPCAVVPYKFDVPQAFGGGGRGAAGRAGGAGGNAPAEPTTPLNPQPICGTIIGQLYNDDKILSVAHQLQTHVDFMSKRPTLA
jgi:Asp-tRNA(Asn)/Glu-tRNA(Gln) amidotransferase A subunit family amidase